MLKSFEKSKLKINTKTFDKIKKTNGKPDIIKTFKHLCPDNKVKRSYKAVLSLCPLHKENNPSFAIYEKTNTYYCFSCQASGDSYKLIMLMEELDFKGALQYAKENNLYE